MSARTKLAAIAALARGDDVRRWLLAERAAAAVHPRAVLGEFNKAWLHDDEFRAIYNRFETNRRRMERVWTVDQLAAAAASLDGDFAEAGTYTGLTAYMLCRRADDRPVHLFDSWEGLSEPAAADGIYWSGGDLASSENTARRSLAAFPSAHFHKGWIPERFHEVADRRFAIVHIDVDLYEPTRDSLAFFYDRIVPGGYLVCDDYGFTNNPGARQAVDEFFATRPEPIVHLPTAQALVVRR